MVITPLGHVSANALLNLTPGLTISREHAYQYAQLLPITTLIITLGGARLRALKGHLPIRLQGDAFKHAH